MGYVDGRFRADDYGKQRRQRRPALTDKRANAILTAAGYVECGCDEMNEANEEQHELMLAVKYMRDLACWHFHSKEALAGGEG